MVSVSLVVVIVVVVVIQSVDSSPLRAGVPPPQCPGGVGRCVR